MIDSGGVPTADIRLISDLEAVFSTRRLANDPWELYNEQIDRGPVAYSSSLRAFVIFGLREVTACLMSPELTVVRPRRNSRVAFGTTILDSDGPFQEELRQVLSASIRPREIDALRGIIMQIVTRHIDRLAHQDAVDWTSEFARPLPMEILLALLGIPVTYVGRALHLVEPLRNFIDVGLARTAQLMAVRAEIDALIRRFVLEGGREPSEDAVLARGLRTLAKEFGTQVALDHGALLFVAGTATTSAAIGQLARMAMASAEFRVGLSAAETKDDMVRRCLRLEPPVRFTPRFCPDGMELFGQAISPNQLILCCLASANRDRRVLGDGDDSAEGSSWAQSVTFGRGFHSCIGAFLAEAEVSAVADSWHTLDAREVVLDSGLSGGWTLRQPDQFLISRS